MTPVSAPDWHKRAVAETLARLAEHRIEAGREFGPMDAYWRLARPGNPDRWYEVVLRGGRLYVDGDCDPIGFWGSTMPAPLDYLRWIGAKTRDLRYAVQKATAWWGSSDPFETLRADVALYDLGVMRAEHRAAFSLPDAEALPAPVAEALQRLDGGGSSDDDPDEVIGALSPEHRGRWGDELLDIALLRCAMERLDGASHDEVRPAVEELIESSTSGAMTDMGSVGGVYSDRLIFGVAAVARLHHLVTGEAILT